MARTVGSRLYNGGDGVDDWIPANCETAFIDTAFTGNDPVLVAKDHAETVAVGSITMSITCNTMGALIASVDRATGDYAPQDGSTPHVNITENNRDLITGPGCMWGLAWQLADDLTCNEDNTEPGEHRDLHIHQGSAGSALYLNARTIMTNLTVHCHGELWSLFNMDGYRCAINGGKVVKEGAGPHGLFRICAGTGGTIRDFDFTALGAGELTIGSQYSGKWTIVRAHLNSAFDFSTDIDTIYRSAEITMRNCWHGTQREIFRQYSLHASAIWKSTGDTYLAEANGGALDRGVPFAIQVATAAGTNLACAPYVPFEVDLDIPVEVSAASYPATKRLVVELTCSISLNTEDAFLKIRVPDDAASPCAVEYSSCPPLDDWLDDTQTALATSAKTWENDSVIDTPQRIELDVTVQEATVLLGRLCVGREGLSDLVFNPKIAVEDVP